MVVIPAAAVHRKQPVYCLSLASQCIEHHDLTSQIFRNHRIFLIASGVLFLFSLIPGLPGVPFFALSLASLLVGYTLRKSAQENVETESVEKEAKAKEDIKKPENIISLLQVDPMELEIGYSLIPLVDTGQGGDLLERIVMPWSLKRSSCRKMMAYEVIFS